MKKIVYLIPGYTESHSKTKRWQTVAKLFEKYGITPIHVDISWKKKTPERFSDYTEEFLKQYKKPKNTEVYVLGFSFGATIAFLTATKTKPKALILCSLSSFFIEDIAKFKPTWLRWWKKNFVDSDYLFAKFAPKVLTKTYIIVENVDAKEIMSRAKDARKKMTNASLIIAKGARHKIDQKKYLTALERIIRKL